MLTLLLCPSFQLKKDNKPEGELEIQKRSLPIMSMTGNGSSEDYLCIGDMWTKEVEIWINYKV